MELLHPPFSNMEKLRNVTSGSTFDLPFWSAVRYAKSKERARRLGESGRAKREKKNNKKTSLFLRNQAAA